MGTRVGIGWVAKLGVPVFFGVSRKAAKIAKSPPSTEAVTSLRALGALARAKEKSHRLSSTLR